MYETWYRLPKSKYYMHGRFYILQLFGFFLKKKKFPLEFPTISNHCCLNSLESSSYSRKCTCHQLTSELHFLLKGFLPEGISKCQDRT